ncbi:MAG TPA: UbiA prenyltransferase family protein [Kiritimatiellia bacterium]|nr:UbiA prenyltransferase family protein [Kiritimatiellia bacterium]
MSILPYLSIARPDHWFKNIFVLPGILLALFFERSLTLGGAWADILLGLAAVCVVASSNYVLNEILDAPFDRHHPSKHTRPIPSGKVKLPLAWGWWVVLTALGWGMSFAVNAAFGWVAVFLWFMGTLYNIPPIRLKDVAYGDVLSESVNNPIRLALGWYMMGAPAMPPLSIIIAYWMFGAFLMAAKRFAEYRQINDAERAAKYRKSFRFYNDERLMVSIFYYATLFALMGGFFIARYRFELILATPLVAYAMAYYMHIAYLPNSPVQQPEQLFRQKKLMVVVTAAFLACTLLLFFGLPDFRAWFDPWIQPPA